MQIKNFINNEYVNALDNQWLDNVNPATGEVYSKIASSKSEDVLAAIEAAQNAFPAWSKKSFEERSNILRKASSLILKNFDELVAMESMDNGKPVFLASHVDIPRAADNFKHFADAVTQFHGDSFDHDNTLHYTIRKPLGVVGCISPWNLPLYLFTWKIAPALAMGNTVVAKPSEVTPLTASKLGEICKEAGFPPGVLNIIHGLGPNMGETLIKDSRVKAISFTGSTKTGQYINETAAPLFKKVSLEMGGKNPNIIFNDCDFDDALSVTMRSSFANQGQICLCGSRIFIQESIYDKFKEGMLEKVKKLIPGDPSNPKTKMGAVVSEQHMNKILDCIELAKQEGGKILCGGKRAKLEGVNQNGFFVEPTIIENLDSSCRTNQEEIFGPVVTITPFKDEEEVIMWANSTDYGLAGSIWTSNIKRAHRVARQIDSGMLWINCWLERDLRTPFGGVKSSGMGREGGENSLKFFSEVQNITVRY